MFQGSTSLKFYKRLNLYKNSTGTAEYNPSTKRARSYNWTFAAEVNGIMVFNTYNWSSTTSGHQSAVRGLMPSNTIFVDAGPHSPSSFDLKTVETLYRNHYELLFEAESARQQDSGTNQRRYRDAKEILENAEKLESLGKEFKVSEARKLEIFTEVETEFFACLHEKHAEDCRKYMHLKNAATNFESIEL